MSEQTDKPMSFKTFSEMVGYQPNRHQARLHHALDRAGAGFHHVSALWYRGVGKTTGIVAETAFTLLTPNAKVLVVTINEERANHMVGEVHGLLKRVRPALAFSVRTKHRLVVHGGGELKAMSIGALGQGGAAGLAPQNLLVFDEVIPDADTASVVRAQKIIEAWSEAKKEEEV